MNCKYTHLILQLQIYVATIINQIKNNNIKNPNNKTSLPPLPCSYNREPNDSFFFFFIAYIFINLSSDNIVAFSTTSFTGCNCFNN